jgi:hypothetical protein
VLSTQEKKRLLPLMNSSTSLCLALITSENLTVRS